MKNKALLLGLSLSIVALISACKPATDAQDTGPAPQATASLTETYWNLKQLNGKPVKMTANQQREQHFVLKTKDGQLNGFSGCNSFFGSYEATAQDQAGSLEFGGLGATKMACPDVDLNEQEFLTVFGDTANYKIDGESLILLGQDSKELAIFEAVYLQ